MLDKVLNFILDQKKTLIKEGQVNSPDYEDLSFAESLIIKQQTMKTQEKTTEQVQGKGIDALFPSIAKGGVLQ